MAESSMAEGVGKRTYVWGAKVGSNYKSVTIDDEVFALGDCVRCPLNSKPEHVGKIVRLFEKEGKGMCRIRSFYTPSEVTESAKGLDNSFKPKEVFLASGEEPGVEMDMLLETVAGKCIILCTAEESFNEIPSPEQLEAADYFFCRGYDPAGEEVVGLDTVEEAIGAQKVYNKKEWLAPADKTFSRSTSQVSAGKVQRQSPAVSGSSSHQGAAIAMRSPVPEVSPAPSAGSSERKLKDRMSEVPEPSKVDGIESKKNLPALEAIKGETSAMSIQKPSAYPQHVTFAIPAPSRFLPSGETKKALPGIKRGKPPISSSTPKSKAVTPGGRGVPVKVPSSSDVPVGLKKKVLTKDGALILKKKRKVEDTPSTEDGAVSGEKRKKLQHMPSTEVGAAIFEKKRQHETKLSTEVGAVAVQKKSKHETKLRTEVGAVSGEKKSKNVIEPSTEVGAMTAEKKRQHEPEPIIERAPKKMVKPMERSNASSERESPSEFPTFVDRSPAIASAPAPEQKHHGQIFKPRIEDWEVANLIPAINSNRVLLLENVDAELHSDDLAEALTQAFKVKCDVRIAPLVSPHFRTTSALLKLPSRTLAVNVLEMMNTRNVTVRSRLVSATVFKYSDFKAPTSKHSGHIEFVKEGRDFVNEDYRDALATSHFAQGNTIEFDYGLPWKVLAEQRDEQWKLLQKHVQDTNPSLKI